jgi:hypothetical protein
MVSVPDIRYLYHHLFHILSFHSSFYCSLTTIYLSPLFISPLYCIFTITHTTYSQSLLSHSTESKSYIYLYFIFLLILFPRVISTYNRSVFPLQYSHFYHTRLRLYLLTIKHRVGGGPVRPQKKNLTSSKLGLFLGRKAQEAFGKHVHRNPSIQL